VIDQIQNEPIKLHGRYFVNVPQVFVEVGCSVEVEVASVGIFALFLVIS